VIYSRAIDVRRILSFNRKSSTLDVDQCSLFVGGSAKFGSRRKIPWEIEDSFLESRNEQFSEACSTSMVIDKRCLSLNNFGGRESRAGLV